MWNNLVRNIEIFFNSFDSGDICLELGAHFDKKVKRLRHSNREWNGKAHKTRTQSVSRENCKERRQCSDQICNLKERVLR